MSDNNDFWELNTLPRKTASARRPGWDTSAIDIQVDHENPEKPVFKVPAAEEIAVAEAIRHVDYNSSFKSIEVLPWRSKFSLYSDFVRDAAEYHDKTYDRGEYRYFFSYRSQYSELSTEQLRWYLTWRADIRRGTYVKTDLSYIFLYIYELLNTAEIAPAEEIVSGLLMVWRNFRDDYPRLDKYMTEWVADACLIHNIRPDMSIIHDFFRCTMENSSIKDFYLNLDSLSSAADMPCYLPYLSNYDFTKSKFYTDEATQKLFDTHIPRMTGEVLAHPDVHAYIKKRFEGQEITQSREAYVGAVCAYKYKKLIKCTLVSYLRSFDFRAIVTNIVKYAENCCRLHLGMKKRLYQVEIDPIFKALLDRYALRHLPHPGSYDEEVRAEVQREFSVDLKSAAAIEQESWDITKKLIELQSEDGEPRGGDLRSPADAADIAGQSPDNTDDTHTMGNNAPDDDIDGADDVDAIADRMDGTDAIAVSPLVGGAGDHAGSPLQSAAANASGMDTIAALPLVGRAGGRGDPPLQGQSADAVQDEYALFTATLSSAELSFLRLSLAHEGEELYAAQEAFAREGRLMVDLLIESINEKAYEMLSDIVFDVPTRSVIDDYTDVIRRVL